MSTRTLFRTLLALKLGAALAAPFTLAHGLELPKNLDHEDRVEVVRLVGLGTSSKLLTNPFPLGGYPGLEVGVSLELVNTADLSRLGAGTSSDEREFRFPRISFGKGLYNNVDVFFHFVPFSEDSQLSEYGGLFRWSFYQAKFLPINLSLLLHGSVLDVNDSLSSQTLGSELIAGISVNSFSLYFGGGFMNSSAEFVAQGTDNIVAAADPPNRYGTVEELVRETHSVVGFTIHFFEYFLAAQIDRYREPVYSLKLGLRL
ncbi:MAG: hypothetical protein IT288_15785 [Bdellovibrionales bacterium]|nr:hypothetical protein [Bdellovibrionales bacterium]